MSTTVAPRGSQERDIRVIDYLNDKFQTLSDLDNLDTVLTAVQTQQQDLRDQLVQAEAKHAKLHSELQDHSRKVLIQTQLYQQNQSDIDRRIQATAASDTAQDAARSFEESMEKLRRLEVAKGYVSLMLQAHELSEEARKHITTDPKAALIPYNKLQLLAKTVKKRNEELESPAVHLVDFVEKATDRLWDEMKEKLAGEFREALNKLGWPTTTPDVASVPEFARGFEKLLILQGPELEAGSIDKPLLPLEILVKPLELRFRYHFGGDRQTNRLDKPEWFLSHLTSLVGTYLPFLESSIQPLLSSFPNPHISSRDAIIEFIAAILPILRRKIHTFLPQIMHQAQLLSHFIHEMIKFDAELREVYFYVPYGHQGNEGWKGVTHEVLVVEGGFNGWVKVEKEFALSRYQNILSAEDAWVLDYDSVEANETKPTKSAMRLKDLLETITERYRPLTSFSQRLHFLINIQIAILDQYHDRLYSSIEAFKVLSSTIARAVQGTSKEEVQSLSGVSGLERLCKVYGSALFMENCMRDWGEDIFFLELWEELQTRATKVKRVNTDTAITGDMNVQDVANVTSSAVVSGDDDGALFDETANAFRELRGRAEGMIVDLMISTMREELKAYSRIALWSSIDPSTPSPNTLSPEILQPLSTLSSLLAFLSRTLSTAVFRRVFKPFAAGVGAFIWDYVITRAQFSYLGASQFARDVEELWNVCARFIDEPENYMRRIKDSVILLALPTDGEAGLRAVVKEVFEDNEKARGVMERLGVVSMATGEVRGVLGRRVEAWA
ncbi:hypothetical protein RUND412_001434 [Rhizina undulata]